jgi:trehalose 6-phosphate phosphatase
MALRRIREEQICDTAIYVGDDETDEDVFHLDEPGQLLTIRVGGSPTTRAMFCLRSQGEIDQLLRCLVKMRPAARPLRSGDLTLQR